MVDLKPGMVEEIFRRGPLSSFGTKIRIAYALGIYGEITLTDLLTIGQIRNVFAHAPRVVTFAMPEIASEVARLRVTEEYAARDIYSRIMRHTVIPPFRDRGNRRAFLNSVFIIVLCIRAVTLRQKTTSSPVIP